MMNVYLDTSAIVKRYLNEESSDKIEEIFKNIYNGNYKLVISVIVLGEVSIVFDKYERKQFIENANLYYSEFINEIDNLTKINSIDIINITPEKIIKSGKICLDKHSPLMDVIHIVSAINSDLFITADKEQYLIAIDLGLNTLLI